VLAQRVVVHDGEVANRVLAGVEAQVDMGVCQAGISVAPGSPATCAPPGMGLAAVRTARIRPSSITTGSVVSEGLVPSDIAAARRTVSRRAPVWVCSAIGGTVRPPGDDRHRGKYSDPVLNFSASCPAARIGL
jgi:hypothetical protein